MAERPILFSAPMVRAILDGRKTQTRRVVAFPQFDASSTVGYEWHFRDKRTGCWHDIMTTRVLVANYCPYGKPGDLLWVRETWGCTEADHPLCKDGRKPQPGDRIRYRADLDQEWQWRDGSLPWRPSIFMPRWASRITLKVEEVRVQRLQEISKYDAQAEGVWDWAGRPDWWGEHESGGYCPKIFAERCQDKFQELWDSLNKKKHPWSSNPFVWAVTFSVAEGPKE